MTSYTGYVKGGTKPAFELINATTYQLSVELKKCRLARREVVRLEVKVGTR